VKRLVAIAAALAIGIAFGLAMLGTRLPDTLRERVETFLTERLDSTVELGAFDVALVPPLRVGGERLVLRARGDARAPLIRVERFSVSVGPVGLLTKPRRVRRVSLDGLSIHVPPRLRDDDDSRREQQEWKSSPAIIGELVAANARLELASRRPDKPPRVFQIHDLRFTDAQLEAATPFRASLTNPTPPGRIETSGTFGPWVREDPGATPIAGDYTFTSADLGVFDGIAGTLASRGRFEGPLESIRVQGTTEVPDFALASAGNRVPLQTRFDAVVDGTSGDTLLNVVDARLVQSRIVARGRVVRAVTVKGRTVALDVTVDDARMEDLLRLAVKGAHPPMSGVTDIRTRLLLPAGKGDVVDRLQLDGEFGVASARFTEFDVQRAIAELSRRGRGQPQGTAADPNVVSNLQGRFSMRDGRMRFSSLTFSVPGAMVRLAGEYALRAETLDFSGDLVLDAALSETTTGVTSVVLKAVDPWFRRGGRTVLPIRVTGVREKPRFGLEAKRALLRK
jgi:hypothetical protein